ncbi:head maturation protease, ClpP-related [Halomonas caseinilytica]|uniref:ATP-dependent Clp protease proteolytic subunit n=1 Tax=Halomonas caseinilytica TaxID=438744 RepID=A0A1M6T9J9_9GAMM|nr:head maturation protease, ClpP-related [Halomonas caseinilytica]SHK53675.1 ATP-dependent protease ClpP, protease subunit [Halomonas caseinilytica]
MPWFSIQARDDNPRHAHVVIDKPIGSDWAPDWINDFLGLQPAREFIAAVDELGELDEITVEINSPGGDVASGVRIYHYLRGHSAKVNTRVTGMAASIATVIMMAGDTRSMAIGSNMMTHRASALICGAFNVADMEEIARNLKKVDASLVEIYTATTGKSADEINALLDQGDTYLDAEEAMEWGFATDADESLRAVASADIQPFMKQLEQQGEIAKLKAQLKGQGDNATMTAADALALAFDLTPEQAEAQAADLGDRIIALRQAQPGAVESFEITAESLQNTHPDVVAAIKAAALAEAGPAPNADEVIAAERTRVTAIVKACQTTGQTQLLDKLIDNGMPEDQASDYIYDVAAASGNRHAIHNSHSPEGGHRAGIDYQKIYDRQNRKTQA